MKSDKSPLVIGLIALLVFGLAGAGTFAFLLYRDKSEAVAATVAFTVNADGWSEETSSPIPVHVTGETVDNEKVDEKYFIGHSENNLSLKSGTYEVEVYASPVNADGGMYSAPKPVKLVIPTKEESDEPTADTVNVFENMAAAYGAVLDDPAGHIEDAEGVTSYTYRLVDINGDNLPELLLAHTQNKEVYSLSVFTTANDGTELVRLDQGSFLMSYGASSAGGYRGSVCFSPTDKTFFEESMSAGTGDGTLSKRVMTDNKLEPVHVKDFSMRRGESTDDVVPADCEYFTADNETDLSDRNPIEDMSKEQSGTSSDSSGITASAEISLSPAPANEITDEDIDKAQAAMKEAGLSETEINTFVDTARKARQEENDRIEAERKAEEERKAQEQKAKELEALGMYPGAGGARPANAQPCPVFSAGNVSFPSGTVASGNSWCSMGDDHVFCRGAGSNYPMQSCESGS
ncbi:MAG: hypothetical protein IKZ87_02215 [Actinomycetaceae bacterium]|nr:hypothetical protein [Actinomycetaceae bacterium]